MKIIIAGDYCPRERVLDSIEKDDFSSVFGEVKDVILSADYSILNFECPVVVGEGEPIDKIGPNLRCSEKGITAIKWAGFKCVSLANNHFYDYGDKGVADTLEVCDKMGIDSVGGGRNIKESSLVLYKMIDNKSVAIINCCEHEFSIADDRKGGANPLNPIQQYYAIQEAKEKADYVVVIVHGGHEHWQLPSPRMQETYRFFIDLGADVVVNHHQHCFSGYEIYKERPIFYGLGNFCFDRPDKSNTLWNQGYMVKLNLDTGINWDIIPYNQCDAEPRIVLLNRDAFDASIEALNDIILNKEKLAHETNQYYKACARHYSNILEPIRNRFYLACKQRGWLPSLISKKNKLTAKNYIYCEAHRDKLNWWLNH